MNFSMLRASLVDRCGETFRRSGATIAISGSPRQVEDEGQPRLLAKKSPPEGLAGGFAAWSAGKSAKASTNVNVFHRRLAPLCLAARFVSRSFGTERPKGHDMDGDETSAKLYRERARKLYAIAEATHDKKAQDLLFQLAAEYERMAETRDALASAERERALRKSR
jgi:hypothetical protein